MKTTRIALLGVALLCGYRSASAETPREFKLVVHPSNSTASISRSEAASIFLKKTTHWSNGATIVVIDLPPEASVRQSFSSHVLGKSVAAVKSFWQQQIFSGRDVPPVEKRTDEEVIAFIRSNANAIGYIGIGTPTQGLRVVEISE